MTCRARPGFHQPRGAGKYDAWAGVEGTSADDARDQYVALAQPGRLTDVTPARQVGHQVGPHPGDLHPDLEVEVERARA